MSKKGGVVLHCRTCTRACKQHKSLLDEIEIDTEESTTLASMLNFCSGLTFDQEDENEGMPQHICLSCMRMLEDAFNFKRMVIDSDELLRLGLKQGVDEEYVMIEMLNEEQEGANTVAADDVAALVETLNDPPEAEYIVETVTEQDAEPVALEVVTVQDFAPVDVEYVTIKSECDSMLDDDEIEVMDCPSNHEEEIAALHDDNAEDVAIIAEADDTMDMEREEHLLTGDSNDIDNDEDYLEESMDSTQMPGEVMPYICSVCGKAFRQQCRLNQHMRSHVNEKLFNCEVCDKKLKHLRNYKEHMLTHTNLKPHQCNICFRYYRTPSSLSAHKRTHAENKPYKCDQCGRGYAAFDHLRRHKLTHTGERPYACDLCDKAYYDSSSLRQHKFSHTGEKAFTCEICGVGLSQKSGYKKHMLVHSGAKPHKCPICGRAFTFTSNLNAHVRLHSGEKPFICETCLKAFPTKKRLNSHLRVHNKEAPVTAMAGASAGERPNNGRRSNTRSSTLPDVPDQQVSTSKVVVVL